MPEKRCNVPYVEVWRILLGRDEQVFRQRQLALSKNGVGAREQLLRPAHLGIGHVALTADRKQEGMDPSRIDSTDGVNSWYNGRDDRTGQLMDDGTEPCVLLRRPADDGERPNRSFPVIDALDVQHREIVLQAVVAEVIAKRPLGQRALRIDGTNDAEISLGRNRQQRIRPRSLTWRLYQANAPPSKRPSERQFR